MIRIHNKRAFVLLVFLMVAKIIWAQNTPDWYDEGSRRANYPSNIYYSGIAYCETRSVSSESDAIKKAEQDARAEALSKILVSVNSKTGASSVSTTMTTTNGMDEQYLEQFSSLTNINVAFKDVPGLQCQHYKRGRQS
jgi:hypothetical protein